MKWVLGRVAFVLGVLFLSSGMGRAETVRLLRDPMDSIRARIELMDSTKEELLISALIFSEDAIGWGCLAKVKEAVERGVKVYIAVDAGIPNFMDDISDDAADYKRGLSNASIVWLKNLTYKGEANRVVVGSFNEFNLKRDWHDIISKITMRFHDKLMISDRKQVITGGRNLDALYYHLSEFSGGEMETDAENRNVGQFDDLDILVISDSKAGIPADAAEYFMQMMRSPDMTIMNPKYVRKKKVAAVEAEVLRAQKMYRKFFALPYWKKRLESWEPNVATQVNFSDLEFMNDVPGLKGRFPGTAEAMEDFIRGAKYTVSISSPYVVMTENQYKAIEDARKLGVEVIVYTNSNETTDMDIIGAVMDIDAKRLLKIGVKVFEYQGENGLHVKAAVRDGQYSAVGTFNLNRRSALLDTENIIFVRSQQVASQLLDIFGKYPVVQLSLEDINRRDKTLRGILKPMWNNYLARHGYGKEQNKEIEDHYVVRKSAPLKERKEQWKRSFEKHKADLKIYCQALFARATNQL